MKNINHLIWTERSLEVSSATWTAALHGYGGDDPWRKVKHLVGDPIVNRSFIRDVINTQLHYLKYGT